MSSIRSLFQFFHINLISLYFISPIALAQNFRIAYVTSNSADVSEKRASDLKQVLNSQWKLTSGINADFDLRVYRYDIRESGEQPIPEAATSNDKLVGDVLSWSPDVIYAAGAGAAKDFAASKSKIPIVIGCKCNPGPTSRRWNLIKNICAPEANITGFTRYDLRITAPQEISKQCEQASPNEVRLENLFSARLQVLKDSKAPQVSRIGLIAFDDYDEAKWQYISKAERLGISVKIVRVYPEQIPALAKIYKENGLDAAMMLLGPLLDAHSGKIIRATSAIGIPTLFPTDEADSGAWMHFGTKVDIAAEAARYIVAILQGTPISKLPVSFPTEYELVVNHKLAKEHGWVFPKKFLLLPQREPRPN